MRAEKARMTIGVVIPVYNDAHTVTDAIDSVLSQKPPPDKLIVVDDGSTDETESAVKNYAGVLEYIRQPHRGSSAARNSGLDRLRTDAVMFLDADDLFLPEAIACRRVLLARDDSIWAHTEGVLQGKSGAVQPFSRANPSASGNLEGWIFEDLLCRNFITTDAVIVRRDALVKIGGFDESIRGTEDWDLWLRLAGRFPVHYGSQPTFVYRVGANTLSGDRPSMDWMRYQTLVKAFRVFPAEVMNSKPAARRSVADAHNGMGYALVTNGKRQEAQSYLWSSVRLWPWQRRAWWVLFRCLLHWRKG